MANAQGLVSRISISLDGTKVERQVMQRLLELVVDQNVHLPDFFRIRLADPDLELIDNGPFDLTKKIKITAEKEDGSQVVLLEGEITALEPAFAEGMVAELVVHGYDLSHRLLRETKSSAYLNQKDSDLASKIAQSANLKTQIDTTAIVYDHIYQHNQTDLNFLMERAWRIGFECFVRDGTLFFRKPPQSGADLVLTWGKDLLSFHPRLNLSGQVDEVTVKGWDADKLTALVGRAQQGHLYPKNGESQDGAAWAKSFGRGNLVLTNLPLGSQAEADALAAARLDEISGTFLEAEGQCLRRPDVQAGQFVRLKALGKRFSGDYLVTSASHVYSPEGLLTSFAVRGAHSGLLSDLFTAAPAAAAWPGVVVGVVTNTDDPRGWGRVKVKFPWLTNEAESDWARLVLPGAGPQAGLALIPAVDDEVLLTFMNGNFSQPFVLGGLWNGKYQPPPSLNAASKGKKPLVRAWQSRNGHSIVMHDDDDKKVEIQSAGGYTISLDDKSSNITISGPGELLISMDKEITISGKSNLKINLTGDLNLKADGDLTLESSRKINLKASQLNLEGTAQASLSAPNVTVEGSAVAEIKGGLIKLN